MLITPSSGRDVVELKFIMFVINQEPCSPHGSLGRITKIFLPARIYHLRNSVSDPLDLIPIGS